MSTESAGDQRIGMPPPETDLGLRRSLFWRLPPEILNILPAGIAVDVPAGFNGQDFIELLFSEIAAIETRVNPIWQLRVSGPGSHRPQLYVVADNLRLEAEIAMAREAVRPDLFFAIGTAIALDDLALYALSLSGVLAPDRLALAEGKIAASLPIDDGGHRPPYRRFTNYSGGLDEGYFDRGSLTFSAPSEPWRLFQASLLSELMVAFVLLHERAHYGLGHLDFVAGKEVPVLAINEIASTLEVSRLAPAPPKLPRGSRRVLEFQADVQAFFLLCAYALSESGPCRRYERLLAEYHLSPPPSALSTLGFAETIRLSLTAASLTCLAFHIASPPGEEDDPSHPTPQARLMNLMINTPVLSPLAQRDETGAFVIDTTDMEDAEGKASVEFASLVQDVFGMALADLQIVAGALGTTFTPLQKGADGMFNPAQWIADLGAFWISDDTSLNTAPETAAGQEIWSLLEVEAAIDPTLCDFQIERFGDVMQVEVGNLI